MLTANPETVTAGMDDNKPNSEAERWRDKYFTLSEACDQQQEDHNNDLNTLHRALVRISLAADGQDKELDKHLANLRNLLRKTPVNQSSINSNLSDIENALLMLDNQRKQDETPSTSGLQALVAQLLELDLSKDKQKALKQYNKLLTNKASQLSGFPQLIEQYAQLQRQALAETFNAHQADDAQSPHSKDGFFARLFGGKSEHNEKTSHDGQGSDSSDTPDTSQPADAQPANHQAISQREEVSPSAAEEDKLDKQSAVINTLADLLEQLPLAPDTRHQAERLRNHLKEQADTEQLEDMINATAELVLTALNKSQQDFEQLLVSLDQQLKQVSAFLTTQGQNKHARKDATSQMNSQIRSQVGSISKAFGEAGDINKLKVSVESQLKGIVAAMDGFIESETQREHVLEQQLQELQEQLTLAQTESQAMRRKLHNETLRALTDSLTHLPNREAFEERYQMERDRFLRYKHPASLAILDIDHFKQVNDTYGHLVGDRVLQAFAEQVKKMIRSTDFFARFGGEEFILLMPDTTLDAAKTLMEKVRESIENMSPASLGTQTPIAASAGLAAFQLGEKAEQLLERADKALYRAKDHGRNQVAVAE